MLKAWLPIGVMTRHAEQLAIPSVLQKSKNENGANHSMNQLISFLDLRIMHKIPLPLSINKPQTYHSGCIKDPKDKDHPKDTELNDSVLSVETAKIPLQNLDSPKPFDNEYVFSGNRAESMNEYIWRLKYILPEKHHPNSTDFSQERAADIFSTIDNDCDNIFTMSTGDLFLDDFYS